MAVRLRLRRVGRKKLPIYKVVAADSRSPRDGRFIESVGQYEPLRHTNNVEFKEERVFYWLRNGARPTDTVRNLLQKEGLWLKWSLLQKGADENTISEQLEKFRLSRAEKEKRQLEKTAAQKSKKKGDTAETTASAEPVEKTVSDEPAHVQHDETSNAEETVSEEPAGSPETPKEEPEK